jgi:hypothetical protein
MAASNTTRIKHLKDKSCCCLLSGDHKNRENVKKILGFHRTLSTDAIHTGCKGLVRSKDWMIEAAVKTVHHEIGK